MRRRLHALYAYSSRDLVSTDSDPLGHLQIDISSLVAQVNNLESSLSQRAADKINDSVPRMVVDALEERLHELLSNTLKTILPDLLKNYVKKALPKELVSMIDPVPASPKDDTEGENMSTQPQSDHVKDNESTAKAHKEQSSAQGEQSSNQAPPTSTVLGIHFYVTTLQNYHSLS
ncbi:hypothetical protein Tco_0741998 [Tanacetum coccineum]